MCNVDRIWLKNRTLNKHLKVVGLFVSLQPADPSSSVLLNAPAPSSLVGRSKLVFHLLFELLYLANICRCCFAQWLTTYCSYDSYLNVRNYNILVSNEDWVTTAIYVVLFHSFILFTWIFGYYNYFYSTTSYNSFRFFGKNYMNM